MSITLSCSYRIEMKMETKKETRQRRKVRKEVRAPVSAKTRETTLSLVSWGDVPDRAEKEE